METEVICHAHILCYNEAEIIGYTVRHYRTYCSRVIVHDLGSSDGSQAKAVQEGASVTQHDCKGEFDDRLNKQIKQESWKNTTADWVIQADADELIYFPHGAKDSLANYESQGLAVIKPYGYEMLSDDFPTGPGQIYDYVKMGGRDDKWYAKPILFSAKRVAHMEFSTGAHTVETKLKNGRTLPDPQKFTSPPAFLLHFHHIGGLERITRRYDENQKRHSAINKKMRWGNQEPAAKHALDKRNLILPKLERVIA
jgi:hypothetical protein